MGFFNNTGTGIIHPTNLLEVDSEFYPVGTILHLPAESKFPEMYCMCVEDNRPFIDPTLPLVDQSGYNGDCSECAFGGTSVCPKCLSHERKDSILVYFKRLNNK